ncbi:MAG: hypothetical protein II631_06995 [Treponema sp.]|nr:hypothetical protein [Treponema sp.]
MFDIFEFAKETGLCVFFGAPSVKAPECGYLSVCNDDDSAEEVFMLRQCDETDAEYEGRLKHRLECLAKELKDKDAEHRSNADNARRREEIEQFFREG